MSKRRSKFDIRVTEDRMELLLSGRVRAEELDDVWPEIEEKLRGLGVTSAESMQTIANALRDAVREGGLLRDRVLLSGVPPVPPKAGQIEWSRDYFSTDFVVDAKTGAIDYRRRVGDPSVEDGELLASVTEPEEGQCGSDVFGKEIPPPKMAPFHVRIGSNVRVEQAESITHYFATVGGRVRWASNTLAVDNVYTVQGDVGLSSGDIDHPGALAIRGDVLAGSRVRAGGDIEVAGLVEDAVIEAGGSLDVSGGITGGAECKIRVAGGVKARFIQEADIETDGDVVVVNAITNTCVKTRGKVIVVKGRLIGGQVMARGGIEVAEAGSNALVSTLIVTGEDFRLDGEIAPLREEIKQKESLLSELRETVNPMIKVVKRLNADQRAVAKELLDQIQEVRAGIEVLKEEVDDLKTLSAMRAGHEITFHRRVHPEVTVRIAGLARLVREPYEGPVRAVRRRGEIYLKRQGDETQEHKPLPRPPKRPSAGPEADLAMAAEALEEYLPEDAGTTDPQDSGDNGQPSPGDEVREGPPPIETAENPTA
jgi:uncharacterized protein (DUF342 family)